MAFITGIASLLALTGLSQSPPPSLADDSAGDRTRRTGAAGIDRRRLHSHPPRSNEYVTWRSAVRHDLQRRHPLAGGSRRPL